MSKPLCVMPYSRVFVNSNGTFRNCCSANPQIISTDETFTQWWTGDNLGKFRQQLTQDQLPTECQACKLTEDFGGRSFRIVINDDSQVTTFDKPTVPDSWHIVMGNVCNLACWHCGEDYSSTIAQHKRQIKILKEDFIDPNVEFQHRWPDIKQNILNSYEFYDTVTITLLGGEPMYNKLAIDFVTELVDSGLSKRTNIEITTNGTKLGSKMLEVLHKDSWRHISVFVSVDSIGSKSEWLRYGSNWNDVLTNIKHYADTVTRLELHYTVSILNINNLSEFINFCSEHQYRYHIMPLAEPWFMDLRHWDGSVDFIDKSKITDKTSEDFVNLVGTAPINGASKELSNYIKQFDAIRTPLTYYDPMLAQVLDL